MNEVTAQLETKMEEERAASQEKVREFLGRYPEYEKTLRLAIAHEESASSSDGQGWQWHDVDTHPTKLIRLVTEGIARISLRSRQATYYLLREKTVVKKSLHELA
ncbi:MAG TPA: hypothetical protein VGS11_02575 [Candidatus Bathyarchaeia archaeon]|nr:hypothetical protein [Candidatus Bathyarchaeia archaeon]